jgi:hypothetical protein
MKPPFHRILPILKGVLVVCGILFVLQWVVGMFFLSQQLGQLDTLSQQLQHSNNHVVGLLSEEGGKGPSTTPADADAVQVATKQLHEATTNRFQEINNEVARSQQLAQKLRQREINKEAREDKKRAKVLRLSPEPRFSDEAVSIWMVFNITWMIIFYFRGDKFRRIVKEVLIFFGAVLIVWLSVPTDYQPEREKQLFRLMHSDWLSSQQKDSVEKATRALFGGDENSPFSLGFFREGISLKYGDTPDPVAAFQKDLKNVMGLGYPVIFFTLTNTMPIMLSLLCILIYTGAYFYKRNPDPHWTFIFVPLRGLLAVFGFILMFFLIPILIDQKRESELFSVVIIGWPFYLFAVLFCCYRYFTKTASFTKIFLKSLAISLVMCVVFCVGIIMANIAIHGIPIH